MDGTLVLVGFAGLLALVWKFTDFAKLLGSFSTHKSGIATQLLSWIAGVAAVLLFAASDFGEGVQIPGSDLTLDSLNAFSLVIVGLMVGSAASATVDFKQAFDNTDDASKPPLL